MTRHSRRAGVAAVMRLGGAVGAALLAAGLPAHGGAAKPAERPNILFAIADDWSWPHAGAYGDKVVATPTFDRLAGTGVRFTQAFCAAPSCTPSRGAILTGQAIHRLGPGGNLWSYLPKDYTVYPDLLEAAGYVVGHTRKGWGPGKLKPAGRSRNPAGPKFKSFARFFETVEDDAPFCFWFGSFDPHRPYKEGSGVAAGMDPADVVVPPFLPDTPEVRSDILDYYVEVQRFDRGLGKILDQLERAGRLANTLVVMTSDNGMPFPRAKTSLYDSGSRMPLAISWPARVKPGRTVDAPFVFTDFAPTFLEAAGLEADGEMTGKSWLGVLTQNGPPPRDRVFFGRERHANVRRGDLSYPARAVRTSDFLYIRNFRPDRWPAGDPEHYRVVGPFGDIDGSPSKTLILERRDDPEIAPFFKLACAKRPAEELYDLERDPAQLRNVAGDAKYDTAQTELRDSLAAWMKRTTDPRATSDDDPWDRYPYVGGQRDWPPKQ